MSKHDQNHNGHVAAATIATATFDDKASKHQVSIHSPEPEDGRISVKRKRVWTGEERLEAAKHVASQPSTQSRSWRQGTLSEELQHASSELVKEKHALKMAKELKHAISELLEERHALKMANLTASLQLQGALAQNYCFRLLIETQQQQATAQQTRSPRLLKDFNLPVDND